MHVPGFRDCRADQYDALCEGLLALGLARGFNRRSATNACPRGYGD